MLQLTYKQGGIEFRWNIENLEHIRKNYSFNDWGNLVIEIELFKLQHLERASGNDSVKANISNYESLKKRIEDKIKILRYDQHCSLINEVHQLAKEKDVAALDKMSRSEVEKFMLKWNNNKAFREDYEKKVLQSLERRELSGDGRRRPDKSCSIMHL